MSLLFKDVQKELQEVRPYLIVDGGDIELVEVTENNIVKVEPFPAVELISTLPFNFSIEVLTTSSPTPLPDISLITSAVEKPAAMIRFIFSLSVRTSNSEMIPFSIALLYKNSGFNPFPLSII
jgi:hypothetical protein